MVEGISSIESAIEPMKNELVDDNIDILFKDVKERLSKSVSFYKQGREADLEKLVEEEILSSFRDLKYEVERILKPYVLS